MGNTYLNESFEGAYEYYFLRKMSRVLLQFVCSTKRSQSFTVELSYTICQFMCCNVVHKLQFSADRNNDLKKIVVKNNIYTTIPKLSYDALKK